MDRHFRAAGPLENMPVMLALVGLWHNQGCGYATRAVLPYEQRLLRLPAYLQQLEMESNGKRVAMDGGALSRPSGPVVWGEPGTNGQHAFYQLIHQGTRVVPCEFMVGAEGHDPELAHQHRLLVANCLAQSEALIKGRSLDEARAILAAKRALTGRGTGTAGAAPGLPGQPALDDARLPAAHALRPRPDRGALRAPGLRRRRDARHQLLRPVGGGTRQGTRDRGLALEEAEGLIDGARRRTSEARARVEGLAGSIEAHIEEKPMQSAMIALVAGIFIGLLTRR
jgi:hypothetical protein